MREWEVQVWHKNEKDEKDVDVDALTNTKEVGRQKKDGNGRQTDTLEQRRNNVEWGEKKLSRVK